MLASDLKTGAVYKENGVPWVITRYSHVKSARGSATVKVKAKNLITGQVIEKGYPSTQPVEAADVSRKNVQFIYKAGEDFYFMDPTTYEQLSLSEDTIGDSAKFLVEGTIVQMMSFEDNPVSVELPNTMIFEVTYTEPGYKGNTVSNVYKDATLNNGAEVKVPSFIKIGDSVKIDTRTGDYVSKA